MTGINFSGQTATGAGSAFEPDGAAGVYVDGEWFAAGFAAHQVFNRSTRPGIAEFRFRRFYLWHYQLYKELSPTVKVYHYALYRLSPGIENELNLNLTAELREVVQAGLAMNIKESASFNLGIRPLPDKDVLALFSYSFPLFTWHDSNLNALEFGFRYNLP